MIKYGKITDISLVTDTILIYRKNRYLKCRYDTDTDISIWMIFFRYIDPPLHTIPYITVAPWPRFATNNAGTS